MSREEDNLLGLVVVVALVVEVVASRNWIVYQRKGLLKDLVGEVDDPVVYDSIVLGRRVSVGGSRSLHKRRITSIEVHVEKSYRSPWCHSLHLVAHGSIPVRRW